MIENLVPPLNSRSVVDDVINGSPVVLTPTGTRLPNLEVVDSASIPALERFDDADRARLDIHIPRYLLEEVRWVADAERCDVAEIVVNALDQFLADHWIRNRD